MSDALLEVARTATRDDVNRAYKRLAHVHHPDKGGKPGDWYALNAALEQAEMATR